MLYNLGSLVQSGHTGIYTSYMTRFGCIAQMVDIVLVYNIQYAVYSIQYTVCSIQYTLYGIQYTV